MTLPGDARRAGARASRRARTGPTAPRARSSALRLDERALVRDRAGDHAVRIVLAKRRAARGRARRCPRRARRARMPARVRAEDRPQQRLGRVDELRRASRCRAPAAAPPRPGRCPAACAPAAARASPPRCPRARAARPAAWRAPLATFAIDLLVAMPALAGSPSSRSIAAVISRTTRRIVASSSASPGRR